MTDTFRALCAELVELDQAEPGDYANWRQSWNAAIARARAALAQPQPQGPTVMEIIELHTWMEDEWRTNNDGEDLPMVDFARAVLARWGNQ